MRSTLFAVAFCLLLASSLSTSPTKIDNYIQYKTLPNTDSYDKVAYYEDQTKVIFYSDDKTTVDVYSTVDYSIISKGNTEIKKFQSTAVQFFTNSKGEQSYLIAKSPQNQLYQVNLDKPEEDPILLATFDKPIYKIGVSFNKKYYAIIFKDQTKVMTADLDKPQSSQYEYQLNVKIQSIRWHPKKESFAYGGPKQLQIMDINQKEAIDYKNLADGIVQDVQFSSDGVKLAYILKPLDNPTEQFVFIFNQDTKKLNQLVATGATQLTSLKRQSQILTAFDETYIYAWRFDQYTFGRYVNFMNGYSVSPDGADFIALTADSKSLVVYKLCPQFGTFYSNIQQICLPCSSPCKTCFSSQDHCSSCPDEYFFSADFTCQPCLDNCQTCKDGTTCSKCIDSFFYQQNKCNLCGDSMIGCSLCKSSDVCDQCDSNMHWTINTDKKCSCSPRYIQVDKTCEQCPLGCYICTAVNICKTCDIAAHRSLMPVGGKCECQRAYFEDENKVCKACSRGCIKCNSNTSCLTCDTVSHWVPSGNICTCASGYYLDDSKVCITCGVMQNCLTCSSNKICTSCTQGYVINTNNLCEKEEEPVNLLVVILIGSAVLIGLAVGGYFIYKLIKKRKMRSENSLIDAESLKETD